MLRLVDLLRLAVAGVAKRPVIGACGDHYVAGRAVVADAAVASLLQIEVGSALLSVERLSFTYGDQPVELRRGLYRTDRHYYRNELS